MPSQAKVTSPGTGRSDGPSAPKASPAGPPSPDRPDPPQAGTRRDFNTAAQQQVDKRLPQDRPDVKPDVAEADARADPSPQGQQAAAAKPSSPDKSNPPQAATRLDSGPGPQGTTNQPAQGAGDASQPDTAAAPAPLTGDDAKLATLIVQRNRANAQFQQDVSAAQAKFADDYDQNSYQRARRTANDAHARRLEPILQQMAQINHSGIDSRSLRLRDIRRLAARALAPVYVPPPQKRCGLAKARAGGPHFPAVATSQHAACGYDERGSSDHDARKRTRNVAH
jgi:Meckel syndrome type 1 protein